MSELWYDDHRKDAESFSVELILYNYGEDLQVLRERIALLEAAIRKHKLDKWGFGEPMVRTARPFSDDEELAYDESDELDVPLYAVLQEQGE